MAIRFEPRPGMHIDAAIRETLALARRVDRRVVFDFNGIAVGVGASRVWTVAFTRARWQKHRDERESGWRKSPAGQRAEAERKARALSARERVAGIMQNFLTYETVALDQAVRWVAMITEPADHVESGYKAHIPAIVALLERSGFKANDMIAKDDTISDDMGRWIVGQALQCAKAGMSPHPVSIKFCQDWLAGRS